MEPWLRTCKFPMSFTCNGSLTIYNNCKRYKLLSAIYTSVRQGKVKWFAQEHPLGWSGLGVKPRKTNSKNKSLSTAYLSLHMHPVRTYRGVPGPKFTFPAQMRSRLLHLTPYKTCLLLQMAERHAVGGILKGFISFRNRSSAVFPLSERHATNIPVALIVDKTLLQKKKSLIHVVSQIYLKLFTSVYLCGHCQSLAGI